MTAGRRLPTSDRLRTARSLLVVALVMVAGVAACSTGRDADPGVVVVTLTSTAAPTPANQAPGSAPGTRESPTTTAGHPADTSPTASPPAPSTGSTGSPSTSGPSGSTSTGAPPSSTRPPATSSRSSSGSAAPTKATKPPPSPSTGDLLKDAIALAAAAGVSPADPDTPGPETGPPCPADHQYVDEAPTGLRSDVVAAWKAVVRAGKAKGITVCLNDGKRSRAQQLAQYNEYLEEYGKAVADQLVLPPNKSAHVIGIAVDVQPADAYQWLQSTKGSLGFCRIYDNEAWHFEYNPAYRADGCPARLPQPPR